MKNLLDKLLFLAAILCLALVLSGYTKEGFICDTENYPSVYEDELKKGLDGKEMYQFSEALKDEQDKKVVEPGFNCRRVGFFCSDVSNVY